MRSFQPPCDLILSVNQMRFAGLQWGPQDGMPTLALHGWLDNAASFFALAPRLENLHIIAIDLAGHGKSDHRPGAGAYSLWDDIHDVLAIADQLRWNRFNLLGHSRGAIISTLIAAAFPERIVCAGLIEGFLPDSSPASEAPLQLAKAIHGLRGQLYKKSAVYPDFSAAVRARQLGMFPVGYNAAKALAERGVVAQGNGFCWNTDRRLLAPSAVRLTDEQLAAFAYGLKVPTKLLVANGGLPTFQKNLLQSLPKVPHVHYELLDGGHHLHMEQQVDKVAFVLNNFFKSVAEKNGSGIDKANN